MQFDFKPRTKLVDMARTLGMSTVGELFAALDNEAVTARRYPDGHTSIVIDDGHWFNGALRLSGIDSRLNLSGGQVCSLRPAQTTLPPSCFKVPLKATSAPQRRAVR